MGLADALGLLADALGPTAEPATGPVPSVTSMYSVEAGNRV